MSRLDRSSLGQLSLLRVREFLREPEAVFWTFAFPLLMALALGVAFRERGPAPVSLAVPESAAADAAVIVEALDASEDVRLEVLPDAEAERALARGDVAVLLLPRGDSVVYRFDPAREESRVARYVADDVIQRARGRRDVVATGEVMVTERGSRYIDFLIPGLIGLNLLSTGLWGVGYTIVRHRSEQLLKRFMATPMRRTEFLLSFLVGRLAFLVVELAVLLAFAWLVFRVPVKGSLLAVLLVAVLGAFTFNGLGLLVASRAKSPEGVTGLMNLASVPMWILSGVFFSTELFPDVMQPLIQALPLTALLDGLRALMLEGATLAAIAGELAIVTAWGVGCFGLALSIFRWR